MILVTVGTSDLGFERLIKKMDVLSLKLNEEMVMQIGRTKYEPINSKWFSFLDDDKMQELYNKSNIIVTHDGAGTLLIALSLNKQVIVVPRLKKFNECWYENKFDLAETLERMKRVIVVYDIETLEAAIQKAKSLTFNNFSRDKRLIFFLKKYIKQLNGGDKSGVL